MFSQQHLTRCDEVYWCVADGERCQSLGHDCRGTSLYCCCCVFTQTKGEALPKSNSAFYLLKEQDPDKWENFKAWNILKSTPKFLEPRGDASETTEDKEEEEVATSPLNEVNVEDQPDASADDPPEEKEEQETMTNVLSTSSYKPSDDSSTTTSLVNVVSHASRPKKQHLGRDTAKGKLQLWYTELPLKLFFCIC